MFDLHQVMVKITQEVQGMFAEMKTHNLMTGGPDEAQD
jgi:hypothetical protein